MLFMVKILFAVVVFVVVGTVTLFSIRDVTIPQEPVKKTIAQDKYLND